MVVTRADFNTATKKQQEFWSDFTTDFGDHPVTHELLRLNNENAVKRSIRNLILTNKTERLFNPELGSNINRLLFEPMIPATAEALKHAINDTITSHEPRVRLSNIEVIPDEISQLYRVNIFFMVVNRADPMAMTVLLYRVR